MAAKHELKVGDVLRAIWGYDQTNVDYYQVVELNGAPEMVKSTKINWTITRTGGAVTPFEAKQEAFEHLFFEHLDAPNVMPTGSCVSWDPIVHEHGAGITWRNEN